MDLVRSIYAMTKPFPRDELYGLTGQLRRSAVSIPSNIAEGQGRKSTKEFLHHLSIAHGSVQEVETQVLIAQQLAYLRASEVEVLTTLTARTGQLINGLYNSLSRR